MQKKLIALAVAGLASTAAFAQSNVTVYGIADATFELTKADGAATSGNSLANRTRLNTNSSYFGLKGVEDLGNGLKAVFQFENGVSFDTATGTIASRDSYVALAGAFGTVAAGNLTGPTRGLGIALDVNAGATTVGGNTNLLGKLGNAALSGTTTTSIFDTRWKNTIAYISPSFSGLTLVGAYVSGEDKSNDGTVGAAKKNTVGYDIGATYSNGPIYAGLTYNRASTGAEGTTGVLDNIADLRIGAYYKFQPTSRVGILYDRVKANFTDSTNLTQTVWYLSGVVGVGANGRVIAQYGKAGNTDSGTTNNDTGAKHVEVGFEYDLSKRTTAKVLYSRITNDSKASYDFAVNPVTGIGAGSSPSSLAVGLRHAF